MTTTARPLWGIARYELIRVARDRLTLFFLLGLPLLVMVIIGSTFGGTSADLHIGIIHTEASPQTIDLVAHLEDSPALTVTSYVERDELERDIRTGRQLGGLIIKPSGRVGDTTSPVIQLLTEPTSSAAASVRTTVTGVLDRQQAKLTAATVTSTLADTDLETALDRVSASPLPATRIERTPVGDGQPPPDSQYAYTVPSQLVLFIFIAALGAGAALVDLNRLGISRRMLSAPVPLATLVGGLTLARLALTLLQAGLLITIGALVFDVRWGDPAGVVALVAVYSLVAVGAGLLIGTVAHTSEQAMAIGVPVAMGMGMLGGTMWPLDLVGHTMRTVGHATPHAWIMDGWITLVFDRGTFGDLTRSLRPSPASPSPSSAPAPSASASNSSIDTHHPPPQRKVFDMSTNDILDRTGKALAASSVFGPAHQHNGITVIPAAAVRGGGGGGGGSRNIDGSTDETTDASTDTGEGGGFGLIARPAGAIVISGDDVTWKAPPLDLTRIIIAGNVVAVAYFLFAWLTARAND